MKDVFLVYDKSCFYEIVILNYFMSFSHCDMVFCSLDGKPVRAMEGFSVNVDMPLETLEIIKEYSSTEVTMDIWEKLYTQAESFDAELVGKKNAMCNPT